MVGAAAAAVVLVVARVDPNQPGHYPTCPFLFVTGHWCPGCGTLRTIHALAHGDLAAALSLNVLTVSAIPLLVWIWWRWTAREWAGRPRGSLAPPWRIWALLLVVLTFWLLRNVSAFRFLAP